MSTGSRKNSIVSIPLNLCRKSSITTNQTESILSLDEEEHMHVSRLQDTPLTPDTPSLTSFSRFRSKSSSTESKPQNTNPIDTKTVRPTMPYNDSPVNCKSSSTCLHGIMSVGMDRTRSTEPIYMKKENILEMDYFDEPEFSSINLAQGSTSVAPVLPSAENSPASPKEANSPSTSSLLVKKLFNRLKKRSNTMKERT